MSLEDSKKKKNYSNVAPLSTKKGRLHHRKLKIKKALEPIGKVVKSAIDWVKKDLKEGFENPKHPLPIRKYPPKKDWENIH